MINTRELKDGDVVHIWVGSEEGNEGDPLVKLTARFQNGLFVTTQTKKFKSGETSWVGEIYGSSVVKYKKVVS